MGTWSAMAADSILLGSVCDLICWTALIELSDGYLCLWSHDVLRLDSRQYAECTVKLQDTVASFTLARSSCSTEPSYRIRHMWWKPYMGSSSSFLLAGRATSQRKVSPGHCRRIFRPGGWEAAYPQWLVPYNDSPGVGTASSVLSHSKNRVH